MRLLGARQVTEPYRQPTSKTVLPVTIRRRQNAEVALSVSFGVGARCGIVNAGQNGLTLIIMLWPSMHQRRWTQLYRTAEPLTDFVVTHTGFSFSTQIPHIFHQALSRPAGIVRLPCLTRGADLLARCRAAPRDSETVVLLHGNTPLQPAAKARYFL